MSFSKSHNRISPLTAALAIAGCGILLTLPLLINSCLVEAHDFRYHLVWAVRFSEQFWQGELYPRWLQGMNAGLGSPDFFFYPPLPYFVTSLFSYFSGNDAASCSTVNALNLSATFALIASGLTAYLWLQEITAKSAALIAAILYMAWPYHLVVNLYRSFAFAEYWAFVWLPLILFFSLKIIKGTWFGSVGLSVSLALLIFTHLPTFVLFVGVPILYVLFSLNRKNWKVAIHLAISVTLAIGIAAIYWLPAMTTQAYVPIENMATDTYSYANNFLFVGPEFALPRFWRYLEITTALSAGLACGAWIFLKRTAESKPQFEPNYWVAVAVTSLVMMLPISYPIWFLMPIWQKVQFPWRFNVVLTVAAIALVALAIPLIQKQASCLNRQRLLKETPRLLAALFLATILLYLPIQPKLGEHRVTLTFIALAAFLALLLTLLKFKQPFWIGLLLVCTVFASGFLPFRHYLFQRSPEQRVNDIVEISPSIWYPPKWVPQEIALDHNRLKALSDRTPQAVTDSAAAKITVEQWQPRKLLFQSDAVTRTEVTLGQFYYPGWYASLLNSNQSLPTKASELGLLQLVVPAGKHRVSVVFNTLPEEKTGQIVSLIASLGTAVLAISSRLSWQQKLLKKS
ncbi:hypothetical protein [Sphaerothrix gracilis]|uniref:hypothetical protein n=1 Tax=Sphaerothrix gracilis TaxID=3151835 RepID=UPI0031FCEB89